MRTKTCILIFLHRFDWYQNDKTVSLVVYTKWSGMRKENVIIDRTERDVTALIYIEDHTYTIHIGKVNSHPGLVSWL